MNDDIWRQAVDEARWAPSTAVRSTSDDEPQDWLAAGQALR
jgi:hypothetical protein